MRDGKDDGSASGALLVIVLGVVLVAAMAWLFAGEEYEDRRRAEIARDLGEQYGAVLSSAALSFDSAFLRRPLLATVVLPSGETCTSEIAYLNDRWSLPHGACPL